MILSGLLIVLPRALAMLSKYALTIFLIRHLDLSNYGSYQELMYLQALLVHFFGLELYFYFNKEYAKKKTMKLLNDHLSLVVPNVLGLSLITAVYLLFFGKMDIPMISIFLLMSLFEYIFYELYRYLISLNQALIGNIALAAKNLLILLTIYGVSNFFNSLLGVFIIQLLYTGIAAFVILHFYIRFEIIDKVFVFFKWFNRIRVHFSLIILMLLSKFYEFGDKFFVQKYMTDFRYGEYLAISTLGSIILILSTSVVYQPYVGKILILEERIWQSAVFKNFTRDMILFVVFVFISFILAKPILLNIIFDQAVSGSAYNKIILGYSLMSLSYIPLMVYFTNGWQKSLLKSQLYGVLPVIFVAFFLDKDLIDWYFPIVSGIIFLSMTATLIFKIKRFEIYF